MLGLVGTLDDASLYEGPDKAVFTIDEPRLHLIPPGVPAYERFPGWNRRWARRVTSHQVSVVPPRISPRPDGGYLKLCDIARACILSHAGGLREQAIRRFHVAGNIWVVVDDNPRLSVFSAPQVEKCRGQMPQSDPAPWPNIAGCLTALCPARSGSTLLCRQLETLFDVGQVGERLNFVKIKRRSPQAIVRAREDAWFGLKCAVRGLITAELSGFFEAYLDKAVFVRLARRDLVAQAVSHVKATQTGQWHAHRKPPGSPVYDAAKIADAVKVLAIGVEQMRQYAESTGRPHTLLLYEDISTLGLSAVKPLGERLGLPERVLNGEDALLRPIEKMGDAVNDEWKERFLREMSPSISRILEDYEAALDDGGPARWALAGGPKPKVLGEAVRRDRRLDAILARFPEETAAIARATIETLRASFPTATCHAIDEGREAGNRLTVRLGAERSAASAIFTIVVDGGAVRVYMEGEGFKDPAKLLSEDAGKTFLWVRSLTRLNRQSVSSMFDHAVRQASTPLPERGRGELVVSSRPARKTKPRREANKGRARKKTAS
jgi:LPS sulfotransferase NodH